MKIAITLCILLLANAIFARPFDCTLTGNEILCEISTNSPTKDRPGIYAVNPKTREFKCIIPFGKRPRWSPDHKKFACLYDNTVFIADIVRKDFSCLPGLQAYDAHYWWFPTSKAVVRLNAYTTNQPSLVPRITTFGANPPTDDFLWTHDGIEQVGEISFSSDGKQAAYESLSLLPDVGPITSEIRIAPIGGNKYTTIQSPDLQGAFCRNPQWQPHGNVVAFEAFYPDLRLRKVYIYDTRSSQLSQLRWRYDVKKDPIIPKYSMRLYRWSPTGDALLTFHEGANELYMYSHSLFYVDYLDNMKRSMSLTGDVIIPQKACWSPDGTCVLTYKCDSVDPNMTAVHTEFMVSSLVENPPFLMGSISLPDGLNLVDFDW